MKNKTQIIFDPLFLVNADSNSTSKFLIIVNHEKCMVITQSPGTGQDRGTNKLEYRT